ncbi:MAG: hypothetical protein ABIV51_06215 [Saprospiraceae bacterium]
MDSYNTLLEAFLQYDILIECPQCAKKAIVKSPANNSERNASADTKAICTHCGFNKLLPVDQKTTFLGAAVDPYFQYPLWLQAQFEGNLLWAYNCEHLDFLHSHVEAKLRTRDTSHIQNRSLGSRLPKWMSSKKNRQSLLKKITDLKTK